MLLNQRHFTDNPGGGGQPNATPSEPTFDRSQLPKFLQKYPGNSLAEVMANADAGYWNMVNQASNVLKENEALKPKAEAYDRMSTAINPSGGTQKSAVELLAEELGLSDRRLLESALSDVARRESANVFTSALGPVLGEFTATEELASEMGGDEFTKIKPKVQAWLNENPAEKARFEGLRDKGFARDAWEIAIRRWGAVTGGQPASSSSDRRHSGLPIGGGSSARRTEQAPDLTRLNAATEYFNTHGEPRPMLHERFKGTSVDRAVESMQNVLNGLGGNL